MADIPRSSDYWECDSNSKRVKVEVKYEEEWWEIPVVSCELHENTDVVSDLQRSAEVYFPARWEGRDVFGVVQGFDAQERDGYSLARVWYRESEDADYVLNHYGFIGSVGPAAQDGVFKFWVYDLADLLKGIPVSKTWTQPRIDSVLQFVRDEIVERTPFENVSIRVVGKDQLSTQESSGAFPDGAVFDITDPITTVVQILTIDAIEDVLSGGQKQFTRNRDTLVDVLEWISNQVGAFWHFEPVLQDSETGITLVLNVEFASRTYNGQEVDGTADGEVRVIRNDALYNIEPINTVIVRGESSVSSKNTQGDISPLQGTSPAMVGSASGFSQVYPEAEATVPSLVEAAGTKYSGPVKKSRATSVDATKQEAQRTLLQTIESSAEGEVLLHGAPRVAPHDTLRLKPACGSDVYSDVPALDYTVTSVKHTKQSTEQYTTEARLSIAVEPEDIEVVGSMEKTEGT